MSAVSACVNCGYCCANCPSTEMLPCCTAWSTCVHAAAGNVGSTEMPSVCASALQSVDVEVGVGVMVLDHDARRPMSFWASAGNCTEICCASAESAATFFWAIAVATAAHVAGGKLGSIATPKACPSAWH